MKRSEMQSKLMALIINHNTELQFHDRVSAKYLANNILNLIEEAGMLPPTVMMNQRDEYQQTTIMTKCNEWEPENE